MKVKFSFIFWILLYVILIASTYYIFKEISKNKNIDSKCLKQKNQFQILKINYINRLYGEGDYIDSSIFVKTTNGDSIHITELFKRKTLVLYFSEETCATCIEKELKIIDSMKVKDLIFLTKFKTFRNFKLYMDANNFENEIYKVSKNGLGLILENYTTSPLVFYVNENLKITHLHIAERTLPTLSFKYYKFIKYYNGLRDSL